jgi:hypothetical protein
MPHYLWKQEPFTIQQAALAVVYLPKYPHPHLFRKERPLPPSKKEKKEDDQANS